nr:MAG TPA: hypothetical protein [Caudoviricetes sp.]
MQFDYTFIYFVKKSENLLKNTIISIIILVYIRYFR